MQLKDMAKVEAMRLFVKVLEESVQVTILDKAHAADC